MKGENKQINWKKKTSRNSYATHENSLYKVKTKEQSHITKQGHIIHWEPDQP